MSAACTIYFQESFMLPSEFKAWFDGFTEAMDKAPTQKQWARIKERVAEIDGKAVTHTVYVDRYVNAYPPGYWQRWYPYSGWASSSNNLSSGVAYAQNCSQAMDASAALAALSQFDSHAAMNAIGKADAALLS